MDFKEFVNNLEQDLKEALSDIPYGAQVSLSEGVTLITGICVILNLN